MTGSAWTRWTLQVRAGGCYRGGSPREGNGRAIDGKRFDALDVAKRAGGNERGGSSREGSG